MLTSRFIIGQPRNLKPLAREMAVDQEKEGTLKSEYHDMAKVMQEIGVSISISVFARRNFKKKSNVEATGGAKID